MSDQDRISPYNIKIISSNQDKWWELRKISIRGLHKLIQDQILKSNITTILQQTVRNLPLISWEQKG